MPFNPSEFLGNFSSGFARNSNFEAWFAEDNALRFNISDINLPGRSIITDTFQFAPELPVQRPITTAYSPVSFNVILDQGGAALNFLRGKIDQTVVVSDNSFRVNYPDSYESTLIIKSYTNTGETMDQIQLNQAYILQLGDVQLSWADGDAISTVSVAMQYRTWS